MVRRARLVLLAAVVLAAVVLGIEFPFGQLVHARAAVATTTAELAQVRRADRQLAGQVRDLASGSSIQQVAHADYGLVGRGQQSVVIMPGSRSGRVHGRGASLGTSTIPSSDLVPSDALLDPSAPRPSARPAASFWQRLLDRLEFWKASL